MHRHLVRVPILAAAIASVLLLAQGGFGGGHGNLDLIIGVLGLPGILTAVWAPEWVVSHDLLLMVWWPAIWNTLLWAAIAKGIARRRSARPSVS